LEPSWKDLSKTVNPSLTSGMTSPFDLTYFRGSNSLGIDSDGICDHVAKRFLFQSNSKRSREEGPYNTVLAWLLSAVNVLSEEDEEESNPRSGQGAIFYELCAPIGNRNTAVFHIKIPILTQSTTWFSFLSAAFT